jgi:hypothetical protein
VNGGAWAIRRSSGTQVRHRRKLISRQVRPDTRTADRRPRTLQSPAGSSARRWVRQGLRRMAAGASQGQCSCLLREAKLLGGCSEGVRCG